jgi:hypothetical protein
MVRSLRNLRGSISRDLYVSIPQFCEPRDSSSVRYVNVNAADRPLFYIALAATLHSRMERDTEYEDLEWLAHKTEHLGTPCKLGGLRVYHTTSF